MSHLRWVLRTFPFTLLFLASQLVLTLAAHGVVSAFGPWRAALIPAYAAALAAAAVGTQLFDPRGPIPAWFFPLSFAGRLGIFLAADALLARWRGRAAGPTRRHAATA